MDEEHLAILYSGAAAFVYPSKMEGFGMPPLEAAACGTNVILGPFHRDKMHQVTWHMSPFLRGTPGSRQALEEMRVFGPGL